MSTLESTPLFLPLPLVARILSYRVETPADLARARLVCRDFGQLLVSMILNREGTKSHFIAPPLRDLGKVGDKKRRGFLRDLVALYKDESGPKKYNMRLGGSFHCTSKFPQHIFEGARVSFISLIDQPRDVEDFLQEEQEFKASHPGSKDTSDGVLGKLVQTIDDFKVGFTLERFEKAQREVRNSRLLDPVKAGEDVHKFLQEELQEEERKGAAVYPLVIVFAIARGAACVQSIRTLQDLPEDTPKREVVLLKTMMKPYDPSVPSALHRNASVHGIHIPSGGGLRPSDSMLVFTIMNVLINPRAFKKLDGEEDIFLTEATPNLCMWEHYMSKTSVEGVVVVDNSIPEGLRYQIRCSIEALAARQAAQGEIDYRRGLDHSVRDIVDPGLHTYDRNVTALTKAVGEVDECTFPSSQLFLRWQRSHRSSGIRGQTALHDVDFWCRKYITHANHPWLPTYISVSEDGRCKIEDYINTLAPRDDNIHAAIYTNLEKLLAHCIPFMESVYSYVHAIRPLVRESEIFIGTTSNMSQLNISPISFRGQKLQVITRIIDYEIQPNAELLTRWTVDGTPNEEIVLTCLYILDRDESLQGGALEFKRAFLCDEAKYIRDRRPFFREQSFEQEHQEGLVPLGTVGALSGRLVVFPNTHVHRMDPMERSAIPAASEIEASMKAAKCRVVIFNLVNPMRRIVSTREVSPSQQVDSTTRKKALLRRDLMRVFRAAQDPWNWNVRN